MHESKTWPVRKKNEVALQQAEMRMIGWMCGIKLQDRIPSKNLDRDCGKRLSDTEIEQDAMDRKRWRKQIRDD